MQRMAHDFFVWNTLWSLQSSCVGLSSHRVDFSSTPVEPILNGQPALSNQSAIPQE